MFLSFVLFPRGVSHLFPAINLFPFGNLFIVKRQLFEHPLHRLLVDFISMLSTFSFETNVDICILFALTSSFLLSEILFSTVAAVSSSI